MPIAALSFAVVVWGLVPVALRDLVLTAPVGDVMLYRVCFTGLVAAAIIAVRGIPRMAREDWLRLLLATLVGNVGYQLFSILGIQGTPASWTGLLYGLEPIFIALFAVLLTRERPGAALYAGFALALAGTAVLLISAGIDPSGAVSPFHLMLVMLSTMGWGFYTVVIGPVAVRHGSLDVSLLTLAISAVPMLVFWSPGFLDRTALLDGQAYMAIAFLVLFSGILAVAFWNYGAAHMPKAVAGLFLYAQPLVATVAGWALLGEPLGWAFFLGGGLILAGLAVAQRR